MCVLQLFPEAAELASAPSKLVGAWFTTVQKIFNVA
jgi:hypothetical protein